ncbi:MAG: acyl-CoA desaturase, partial [Actinobacteria bacterium]|nr:acyl-CoA desaturase [Actinomycetota bacterium]
MTPPTTAPSVLDAPAPAGADEHRPLQEIPRTRLWARLEQVTLAAFITVPLLAVVASGFVLWGNGLSYRDVVL